MFWDFEARLQALRYRREVDWYSKSTVVFLLLAPVTAEGVSCSSAAMQITAQLYKWKGKKRSAFLLI